MQEISTTAGLHPINVRKWIHRFNRYGLNGLYPRRSPGRPKLFTEDQRHAIVGMASTDPQELGLAFDSWSLQRLRYELTERGIASGYQRGDDPTGASAQRAEFSNIVGGSGWRTDAGWGCSSPLIDSPHVS